MNNIPSWILYELHKTNFLSSSLQKKPKTQKNPSPPLKILQKSPPQLTHQQSKFFSDFSKKQRVKLAPLDYKRKCNKLWTKFDTRISPILQKYSPVSIKNHKKLPSFSPDFYRNKQQRNHNLNVRRFSNPIKFTETSDEEQAESGIQCDIMSDSSENGIKINEADYFVINK